MSSRISLLLADGHTLVRETLAHWLQGRSEFAVVASVANADEAIAEARRLRPNIVVLETSTPGLQAFEAARVIKDEVPESRIVFLSAFVQDRYVEQALAIRASGYLTKTESAESLSGALKAIATGSVYYSADIRRRIAEDLAGVRPTRTSHSRASILTPREVEILCHLAQGLPKKKIARIMCLSVQTVNRHTANLMLKLDIHDRVELARFAIREGLVEP